MNRTKIAAAGAALAMLVPAGLVASAPAAHAAPTGTATVKAGGYWFPPHAWFCNRYPNVRPLC